MVCTGNLTFTICVTGGRHGGGHGGNSGGGYGGSSGGGGGSKYPDTGLMSGYGQGFSNSGNYTTYNSGRGYENEISMSSYN